MSKRAHLYYIDGLRVLGTIAVFVYHLNDQLITLNENYGVPLSPAVILPTKAFGIGLGQAAVALFFVISGFVLMYTTSDSRLDVSRYAKRRILDIFPFFYSAYIVAFFIVALAGIRLIQGPLSAWKLIFTIFGLDGYLSCYPSPFSPNWYLVGEWYLGCLILLYCFFPFIHKLQRESKLGAFLTVVGVPAIILFVTSMGATYIDYTGYFVPGLSCFAAGSFIALKLGEKKPDAKFAAVSLLALIACSFLGSYFGKLLMPIVGIGCFGLFGWFFSKLFFSKLFNKEVTALSFASRISFPFYLMHHVAIYVVTLLAMPSVVSLRSEAFVFVCAFSLSFAWGAVVLWIGSWLKSFTKKRMG